MFDINASRYQFSDGTYDLKSMTFDEMRSFFEFLSEGPLRAQRTFQALWQTGVDELSEIRTIALPSRSHLAEVSRIKKLKALSIQHAQDGTRKYLWQTPGGATIESVLIPQVGQGPAALTRRTLCISSQWGCAMQCGFCLTGDLGLKGNLQVSEIANQVLQVSQDLPAGKRITNIVMMGMGEPLHNYANLTDALRIMLDDNALNLSHRKITVSTVGLVPAIKKLANELPVNLAISFRGMRDERDNQARDERKLRSRGTRSRKR